MPGCEVQACVALVVKVYIAQLRGVVADDALDEGKVVEEDGSTQTPGYVNPVRISGTS
jgi:hypothetical protein